MSRKQNVEIFEDTMKTVLNEYLDDVKNSQKNQRVYKEDEVLNIKRDSVKRSITVIGSDTITVAMSKHYKGDSGKICILNFASATNPGGGVVTGSSAQEESLCRSTTLYSILKCQETWDEFYGYHRNREDNKYTSRMIYSPDVVILKDARYCRNSDRITVDVISCAAPNLRFKPNNAYNKTSNKKVKITDKELLELLVERYSRLLDIADYNEVDTLVLGAIGCGAFKNPPNIAAQAWKKSLENHGLGVKDIVFPVYCKEGEEENLRTFRRVLSNLK